MSEQMGGEELDSLVDIFAGIRFMIGRRYVRNNTTLSRY